MKTSELTGAALDWAVAKCEGKIDRCGEVTRIGNQLYCWEDGERMRYAPSDDWAQGGPIIYREKLSFCYNDFGAAPDNGKDYIGFIWDGQQHVDLAFGPTPLIAAMRCYVASKLGDEVEVPEELV